MKPAKIKLIQKLLNEKGLNAGPADGVAGPLTLRALDHIEEIPEQWNNERKLVAFLQISAREHGFETGPIDGFWGPQTDYAYELLEEKVLYQREAEVWRPEDREEVNPNDWPRQTPEIELIRFYGQPGENQTSVQLPYPHRIAWDPEHTIQAFTCHERVHDSIQRVLGRVLEHYGPEEIERLRLNQWGGCLNVRKMRGGSRYSMHSWGIAIDYDPSHNRLQWGRDRALFARPEYEAWWRFWEEEGWTSLGRSRNFDWMHVQAARI